ncbi:hypothetical protein D7B24_009396 [Verticillium nonalfalfae]|uniref:BZIP domain-containing protein n=1 Tax=Verticillium nonalfalfae TaxID=1051616 RepID=A0A3M9Y6J0_9PEZI|nr:uncharacterized protein D7B24_009396 [Verticillium nonalfalfae]RNJ54780.1 hypothetical protein D7B24_009396 [Verticillium nonalfalfae]
MSEDVPRSSVDGVVSAARRKERGRLAQAAFRRRQIDTIARLRASNQEMQDAIARLARIASGVDNRELAEAARDAQKAAGFDKTDDDSAAKTRRTTQVARLGQGAAERQGPAWRSGTPDAEEDGIRGARRAIPSYYRTGRMSPRLGFGLWLEPARLHVVYPPVDIMPYLQEKTSLSNVLFWASLSYGFKLLQARPGTRYHLLEQGLHDGSDPGVRTMVCAFVGDMVKGSICLGGGPRWTADRATAMLDAFHRRLALA